MLILNAKVRKMVLILEKIISKKYEMTGTLHKIFIFRTAFGKRVL